MQPLTSSLPEPFISIPPQTNKWCKKSTDGEREETISWTIFWWCPWVGKIPWRRKWLPTPIFLPGDFHGQRSLADYIQFTESQRVEHNWMTFTFSTFLPVFLTYVPSRALACVKDICFPTPRIYSGINNFYWACQIYRDGMFRFLKCVPRITFSES